MMNRSLNQNKWPVKRIWSWLSLICERRRWPPGVSLPADNGESGVSNVEAAILIHNPDIRRGCDVEGIAADDAQVLEIE